MTDFRHSYRLDSWKGWDHQLHYLVLDFKNAFGIYPNLLEANEFTFTRIDIRADRTKIEGVAGEKVGPHEYLQLGGFAASNGKYELDFCINRNLPGKTYTLAFDPEPGEKEPLPEEGEFESAKIAVGGSK